MNYIVRRPFTLLGKSYRVGDRLTGAKAPADTLAKLIEQRRLLVDQDEADATAETPAPRRGRSPRAA